MRKLVCWHGVEILPGHAPIHRCKDCEAQSASDKRDQTFLWLYPLKGAKVAIKLHPLHGESPAPPPLVTNIDLGGIGLFAGDQWKPGEFEEAWKIANTGGFRPLEVGEQVSLAKIFSRTNYGIRVELLGRLGKLACPSND